VPNKDGLGTTRKYADGTIHENASGRFVILDRYLEDDTIMLKFKWLDGDNEGQIDTNKEKNISASIHKFQVSRGRQPRIGYFAEGQDEKLDTILDYMNFFKENVVTNNELEEYTTYVKEQLLTREEITHYFETRLDALTKVIHEQQVTISVLSEQVDRMIKDSELNTRQQASLDKLIGIIDRLQDKQVGY
jgi:hypothetical protein